MALLDVKDLKMFFHTRNGVVRAVDGISFQVEKGETVGIVGESGSGKSVACQSLMGLTPQPPGRLEGGQALFQGVDLLHCGKKELNRLRGRKIAMIFQDPMTSLNPYMSIGAQLIEPLLIHGLADRREGMKMAVEALRSVGLHDPASQVRRYPHEFSGGMRQRVMIAMALITKPDLLIADEPTTALDVTVQAQIQELLKEMQRELGTAILFISHDLGVVAGFCDRVLVMYAGRVVESAATKELFRHPRHPYNRALQQSIPALQAKGKELHTIPGAPPDPSKPARGCPFAPRCDFVVPHCRDRRPELLEVVSGHTTACLRVQEEDLKLEP